MADKTWNGTGSVGNEGDLSQADNWTPGGVPVASDNVRLVPQYTQALTAALGTLSGVSLASFIVEDGYTGAVGTSTVDLDLTVSGTFEFNGTGASYIDLEASAIDAIVINTGSPSAKGRRSLNLTGSALTAVEVRGGNVGLGRHGSTSTATATRISGGELYIDNGATVTNVTSHGGTCYLDSNITAATLYGGSLVVGESATITTLTIDGGSCTDYSTGTITTATVNSGRLTVPAGIAKAITTLNLNAGGAVSFDPNNVTVGDVQVGTDNVPITISTGRG
jgi:hypothetical protein